MELEKEVRQMYSKIEYFNTTPFASGRICRPSKISKYLEDLNKYDGQVELSCPQRCTLYHRHTDALQIDMIQLPQLTVC